MVVLPYSLEVRLKKCFIAVMLEFSLIRLDNYVFLHQILSKVLDLISKASQLLNQLTSGFSLSIVGYGILEYRDHIFREVKVSFLGNSVHLNLSSCEGM